MHRPLSAPLILTLLVVGLALLATTKALATCTSDCEEQRFTCLAAADQVYESCVRNGVFSMAQCEAFRSQSYSQCNNQWELCVVGCGGSSPSPPSNGAPPGGRQCFSGCRMDFLDCIDAGELPPSTCEEIQENCLNYCGG